VEGEVKGREGPVGTESDGTRDNAKRGMNGGFSRCGDDFILIKAGNDQGSEERHREKKKEVDTQGEGGALLQGAVSERSRRNGGANRWRGTQIMARKPPSNRTGIRD